MGIWFGMVQVLSAFRRILNGTACQLYASRATEEV
jgi:hypothetical protein